MVRFTNSLFRSSCILMSPSDVSSTFMKGWSCTPPCRKCLQLGQQAGEPAAVALAGRDVRQAERLAVGGRVVRVNDAPLAPERLPHPCGPGEEVAGGAHWKSLDDARDQRDERALRADVLDHPPITGLMVRGPADAPLTSRTPEPREGTRRSAGARSVDRVPEGAVP